MNNHKPARKRVMIVDDEGDLLEVTGKRLEISGYSVIPLSSGARALEIARSRKPDIILLDIVMPGKNGCEICKELKADQTTRDIPIILFSAHYPEKEFIGRNYADFGADDCIAKPYDDAALLEKIKRLIK